MDKQHFDQLVKGVREMMRHVAGKTVRGAKSTELPVPSVRIARFSLDALVNIASALGKRVHVKLMAA